MNIKNFSLATLCILTLGLLVGLTDQVSSAQDQPEVYLNDLPCPIIGSKQELEVPIFFIITENLVDKDLDFYYWREVHEDNSTEYLHYCIPDSEWNWVTFFDFVDIQPLCRGPLLAHRYVKWINPPCKEQEPQKYTLHVCIDSITEDGLYPDESQERITYACAAQEVNRDYYCIPENILLDGQVNPAKISDSVLEGVQPPSHVLTIRDDCDGTVSCQVTSVPYFVDQPAAGNAILDGEIVQFKNNQSIETHNGNIVLECPLGGESVTKEIPVELKVISSSGSCESGIFFQMTDGFPLPIPDGGQIPLSVTAGEEKLISLTCGHFEPLSDFEPNVSGSGCFSVEKDISTGSYSRVKIIPISSTDCSDSLTVSSGTTSATAIVKLTFQESPQTSVISPASVTIPSNQTSAVVRVQDSSYNDLNYEVTRVDNSWISSPKVRDLDKGGLTITINRSGLSASAIGYVYIKPEGFPEERIKVTVEVASTTGSLLLAPSSISTTLPSGDSEDVIFVTCNGQPLSSFSVSDPGKTWLSVGSSRSYSFTLTLNTNGLSVPYTDSADLEVSSSSCGSGILTKTLHVSLTVDGVCIPEVCTPKTAELSRNPISVSVTHGSDAASQSVRIEDNCGNPLAFEISEVNDGDDDWIKSPKVGDEVTNGALSVDFDTDSLSAGTYDGNITISTVSTALGNPTLTLDINLTVSSSSGVTAITLIKGDMYKYFDFKAGEVKLFKFRADSGPSNPTLTVLAEVQSHYGNQNGNLHMMAKYAGQDWENGRPMDSDYADIKIFIGGDWTKLQGVYNGIYYFMTRTLVKRLYINYPEQVTDGCWYLWVKNIGDFRLDDCMVHF